MTLTQVPNKSSLCEWKGRATYWKLKNNDTGEEVKNKIWSYESPTSGFKDIKGYLSFYASGVPWECFVDDEKVQPQEGEKNKSWARGMKNMGLPLNIRRLLWRLGHQRARRTYERWTRHLGLVATLLLRKYTLRPNLPDAKSLRIVHIPLLPEVAGQVSSNVFLIT